MVYTLHVAHIKYDIIYYHGGPTFFFLCVTNHDVEFLFSFLSCEMILIIESKTKKIVHSCSNIASHKRKMFGSIYFKIN